MKWAALIVWVLTALGGFGLLAIWLQRGGASQAAYAGRRIRPPVIFTHLALAAGGLVLWVIYLAADRRGWAWAAFAVLLAVAALGFTMLARWLQRRSADRSRAGREVSAAAAPPTPAEQHFPVPIVAGHGVLAATTLVLVLLSALRVGGS